MESAEKVLGVLGAPCGHPERLRLRTHACTKALRTATRHARPRSMQSTIMHAKQQARADMLEPVCLTRALAELL